MKMKQQHKRQHDNEQFFVITLARRESKNLLFAHKALEIRKRKNLTSSASGSSAIRGSVDVEKDAESILAAE